MIFFPIFLCASGIQHDCHTYLASLKKYTLPVHPAFLSIVCPHYTAECMIYVCLTFMAAPKGQIVNKTVLSGLIFVVVNLGVSAGISKDWYIGKFGKENVQHRWKMIPALY
jgi:3-oxo-5-alpha-steroid 4-dehydrogenase 3